MPQPTSIPRKLSSLAKVAAVGCIAGYLGSLARSGPPPLRLPSEKEVCFVVARTCNSQRQEPDLAPFPLPPESFADFLAKLEPFTKASLPVRAPPIGAAWVIGDDRTWLIEWYWNGKNPLEFSVDGVWYQHIDSGPADGLWPDGGVLMDVWCGSSSGDSSRRRPVGANPRKMCGVHLPGNDGHDAKPRWTTPTR
jgi:hypothetical protein